MVVETSNDCEGVNLAVGVLFYKIAQLEKGCTSVRMDSCAYFLRFDILCSRSLDDKIDCSFVEVHWLKS